MAIILTMTDENGITVDVDIDLDDFTPDSRGNYLDNDTNGLAVVNAVDAALKELHEQRQEDKE